MHAINGYEPGNIVYIDGVKRRVNAFGELETPECSEGVVSTTEESEAQSLLDELREREAKIKAEEERQAAEHAKQAARAEELERAEKELEERLKREAEEASAKADGIAEIRPEGESAHEDPVSDGTETKTTESAGSATKPAQKNAGRNPKKSS